jgi:hypothetical protein
MEIERIIDVPKKLFWLPMSGGTSAISAPNRRHDEMLSQSPWFRL